MKRKHFTLIELIIVVIIVGILATAVIPLYHKAIENAKSKACELNLEALLAATEAYASEHDAFPGSLSELRQQDIDKAFVSLMRKEGQWRVRLVYFLVELDRAGSAFAKEQSLATNPHITGTTPPWIRRYITQQSVLHCPAREGSGISYGINNFLNGKTIHEYDNLSEGISVVADCDSETFIQASPTDSVNGLAARHKDYSIFGQVKYYGHSAQKNKKVRKHEEQ
ncbi:MAG: prepilin-type N-terminal cleavage/methylation domain-containing protein [Candidatus Omnitrophota bacterium]